MITSTRFLICTVVKFSSKQNVRNVRKDITKVTKKYFPSKTVVGKISYNNIPYDTIVK